jgi:hypothetical protein
MKNGMQVKVKDLKKKNDYLFFELFGLYTNQMIKNNNKFK